MNGKISAKKHLRFNPTQKISGRCLALFMLTKIKDQPLYPLYWQE